MFYKPTFCCHCGERISRAERSFADSSRFCDVCKQDFLGLRLAPLIFIAVMAFVGVAGIGGLMTNPPPVPLRQAPAAPLARSAEVPRNVPANTSPSYIEARPANAGRGVREPIRAAPAPVPEEPLTMCGAPTKKGTPCSRKVRGGGRCWQHQNSAEPQKAGNSNVAR